MIRRTLGIVAGQYRAVYRVYPTKFFIKTRCTCVQLLSSFIFHISNPYQRLPLHLLFFFFFFFFCTSLSYSTLLYSTLLYSILNWIWTVWDCTVLYCIVLYLHFILIVVVVVFFNFFFFIFCEINDFVSFHFKETINFFFFLLNINVQMFMYEVCVFYYSIAYISIYSFQTFAVVSFSHCKMSANNFISNSGRRVYGYINTRMTTKQTNI